MSTQVETATSTVMSAQDETTTSTIMSSIISTRDDTITSTIMSTQVETATSTVMSAQDETTASTIMSTQDETTSSTIISTQDESTTSTILSTEDATTTIFVCLMSYFMVISLRTCPLFCQKLFLLTTHCEILTYAALCVIQTGSIPSCVHLWNAQDSTIKNSLNISSFKTCLLKNIPSKPCPYYYYGPRASNINLPCLRLNCSPLNEYLFKIGVLEFPLCRCGDSVETTKHYFLECALYAMERITLHNALLTTGSFNLQTILHGGGSCNTKDDRNIIEAVYKYINDTGLTQKHLQ